MLHIDGLNISLTRGDSAYIEVPIYDKETKEKYEIQPNDVLSFSVKKNLSDTEYVFQKVLTGDNVFHIIPSDTNNADVGTYKYDVELVTEEGEVCTVIEPEGHSFKITSEVTRDE